ncbi:glycosyltransferase family 2 protein [Aestuariispira insulae]|uniref:GT2 family glycosyltransferase n=1 Tax=Aestuariispira insulae TaxID=1461337 RepID=A0A3D9HMU4_9PROT|nr:glycosyltransferase family 2 protein [Aestuariispira insulae]RED50820.1 GT2 family glycosyltransferase [Aestuariispira insulae]
MTTASPDWSRVTIVTVTHNGGHVIGDCLQQFRSAENLIVVDNASQDDTLAIVARQTPQARVIRNSKGVGYGNAANQGLAAAKTEFTLMVNPDSIVTPADVAALLDAADRYPEAGIISPQHKNADGSLELTHDVAMFHRRKFPEPFDQRSEEPAPGGELCAEFISGAVNLIRKTAYQKVGGFDPEIFLYFDDDDICLRMRHAGFSLILVPQAQITHLNGGSVRPSLHYKWEKFWNYGWARLYIENKYRGSGAAWSLGLRHALRFLPKAIGYGLILKKEKALRDMARFAGTIAYLAGAKALDQEQRSVANGSNEILAGDLKP